MTKISCGSLNKVGMYLKSIVDFVFKAEQHEQNQPPSEKMDGVPYGPKL
jgi:hypothetical protein